MVGKNPSILCSGRHEKAFYETLWLDLKTKGHWYGEIWNRRKNGEVHAVIENINAKSILILIELALSDISKISNELLSVNYITLECNHKFNFTELYNEVIEQKTKKILDNSKLDKSFFEKVKDMFS